MDHPAIARAATASVAVLAFAAALSGCSAGKPDASAYIGYWKVSGIENMDSGHVANMSLIESRGADMGFELSEGGSARYDLSTLDGPGSWEMTGDGKIRLSVDGMTSTARMDGDALVFGEDEGVRVTCRRSEMPDAGGDAVDVHAEESIEGTEGR